MKTVVLMDSTAGFPLPWARADGLERVLGVALGVAVLFSWFRHTERENRP